MRTPTLRGRGGADEARGYEKANREEASGLVRRNPMELSGEDDVSSNFTHIVAFCLYVGMTQLVLAIVA